MMYWRASGDIWAHSACLSAFHDCGGLSSSVCRRLRHLSNFAGASGELVVLQQRATRRRRSWSSTVRSISA
jgi:hypothetical protein